ALGHDLVVHAELGPAPGRADVQAEDADHAGSPRPSWMRAPRTLPPASASEPAAASGASPDSRHSRLSRGSPPQRSSSARHTSSWAPETALRIDSCRWRSLALVPDMPTIRFE